MAIRCCRLATDGYSDCEGIVNGMATSRDLWSEGCARLARDFRDQLDSLGREAPECRP
jgi:hypothetical protein